jgi:hypothetical protein
VKRRKRYGTASDFYFGLSGICLDVCISMCLYLYMSVFLLVEYLGMQIVWLGDRVIKYKYTCRSVHLFPTPPLFFSFFFLSLFFHPLIPFLYLFPPSLPFFSFILSFSFPHIRHFS